MDPSHQKSTDSEFGTFTRTNITLNDGCATVRLCKLAGLCQYWGVIRWRWSISDTDAVERI